MASSIPPWSELPQDLLGLIIDHLIASSSSSSGVRSLVSAAWSQLQQLLPFAAAANRARFQAVRRSRHSASADCARFRAVCRSWRSAMREHVPAPPRVPWIVLTDGSFSTPSDDSWCPRRRRHRFPSLPKNARCIGSTDSWLALDCIDAKKKKHSYYLHNPFTNMTVPLPELDTAIGNVSELFEVRKVLMRSTPSDIVAVMTNNWNYPIILIRPGSKRVWWPKPETLCCIIDIAFHQDKLYGITRVYGLVSLGITFSSDGVPMVTGIEQYLISAPYSYQCDVNHPGEEEDDDQREKNEIRYKTGDDMVLSGITYWDEDVPNEPEDMFGMVSNVVESRGKLFLVRREFQYCPVYDTEFTWTVEVFEADTSVGKWVSVSSGLGGQAFFISHRFCKSISAGGDIEQDTIYFIHTGEMFNVRSKTISRSWRNLYFSWPTWIFSPELVL